MLLFSDAFFSQHNSQGNTVLDTLYLKATISKSSLSVTLFDKLTLQTLTTFSYSNLASGSVNTIAEPINRPVLSWTREIVDAVYGIAQSPGFDTPRGPASRSSDGQFLGLKVSSPNGYGNFMMGEDRVSFVFSCSISIYVYVSNELISYLLVIYAQGAFSFTQLPVAYSLGPSNYHHAFFLDDPQPLSWDLASSTTASTVTSAGSRALRWFFIGGTPTFPDLRITYMRLVGRMEPPSKAWFGYHQSKYGYRSFDEAIQDVKSLNNAGIPVDNLVFDLYWFGARPEQDRGMS